MAPKKEEKMDYVMLGYMVEQNAIDNMVNYIVRQSPYSDTAVDDAAHTYFNTDFENLPFTIRNEVKAKVRKKGWEITLD